MSLRKNTPAVESLPYSQSIGQSPTFKARQFSDMSFWAPLFLLFSPLPSPPPLRSKNILNTVDNKKEFDFRGLNRLFSNSALIKNFVLLIWEIMSNFK